MTLPEKADYSLAESALPPFPAEPVQYSSRCELFADPSEESRDAHRCHLRHSWTHGNLSALEAVHQEIRQAKVDCVVVGGNVLPGPLSRETNFWGDRRLGRTGRAVIWFLGRPRSRSAGDSFSVPAPVGRIQFIREILMQSHV